MTVLTVLTLRTPVFFLSLGKGEEFIAEGPGGPAFGTLLYHRYLE